MAINDVSLTAGMRSNLLSLQGTVDLLNRTQNRLSSGKKVNTAIDNPVSFFASQSLNSRASVIDGLKDAMGQAVQTIAAADKGIKAITAMIEQAKGIAQAALSAEQSTGFDTATVTLNSIAAGDTLTIGGQTLVACVAGETATVASIDIAINAAGGAAYEGGELFVVAGTTYTASIGGTSAGLTVAFAAGASAATIATELEGRIDANAAGSVVASINTAGTVNIVAGSVGLTATTVTTTALADEATVTANAGDPIANTLGNLEFARTGNDIVDAINLADKFTNSANTDVAALRTLGWSVTADNGVVTVAKGTGTSAARDIADGDITPSNTTRMVETAVSADQELANLISQYNTMRTQIDELAADSGYKGKNLLSFDQAVLGQMVVQFEGTTLTVQGFDATTGTNGLNMTAANAGTTDWADATDGVTNIGTSLAQMDNALTTMRTNASALSGNLSIITVRQEFSTNMINTLTEGANKLTLADTNEEGANMLMLQTRQSLSTTALSLSAQAAQSVLRLFG